MAKRDYYEVLGVNKNANLVVVEEKEAENQILEDQILGMTYQLH